MNWRWNKTFISKSAPIDILPVTSLHKWSNVWDYGRHSHWSHYSCVTETHHHTRACSLPWVMAKLQSKKSVICIILIVGLRACIDHPNSPTCVYLPSGPVVKYPWYWWDKRGGLHFDSNGPMMVLSVVAYQMQRTQAHSEKPGGKPVFSQRHPGPLTMPCSVNVTCQAAHYVVQLEPKRIHSHQG